MISVNGTGTDCSFTAIASSTGLSNAQSGGTALATISYTLTANPSAFTRVATISVPNASVSVSQNGAPVRTDVAFVSFGAVSSGGMLNPLSPPEEVQLTIDEQPGSAWMVAANRPWMVVTPSTGSGPGTLRVSIDPAAAAALTPMRIPLTVHIGVMP